MAVYTYIEVGCDWEGCKYQDDALGPYWSVGQARKELQKSGWLWTKDNHWCPEHRLAIQQRVEGR